MRFETHNILDFTIVHMRRTASFSYGRASTLCWLPRIWQQWTPHV